MDIIKEPSPNTRIHFFKNTECPDWYFVSRYSDKNAIFFYLSSHHLPPHENSGYFDLPVEWAFALEYEDANSDKFLHFIRYEKGIKQGDDTDRRVRFIGDNGWYEFSDIKNKDNWLNDFYDFQKQRYEEFQQANSNGKQTSLF